MIRYGSDFNPRGDRAKTDYIVIHCSAGSDLATAEDIVRLHMVENGWASCGYHFVIERSGKVVPTLDPNAWGAHVGTINPEPGQPGWNRRALGICLLGGLRAPHPNALFTDNYSSALNDVLRTLTTRLWRRYDYPTVTGHHNLIEQFGARVPKACPCFDVPEWWAKVEDALDAADEADLPVAPPAPLPQRRSRSILAIIADFFISLFGGQHARNPG